MTLEEPAPEVGSTDPSALLELLGELRGAVGTRLHGDTPADAAALRTDLETSFEELRVAEEEIRVQQDHIARLRERADLVRLQDERMLALLPVPAALSDQNGLLRSVNGALAALASRRVARLVGKPAFALFDADDRQRVRRALSHAVTGTVTQRVPVHVLRPEGDSHRLELALTSRPGGGEVTWMFLPDPRAHSAGGSTLPEALGRLAALPSRSEGVTELLQQAAATAAAALAPGAQVAISTGPPTEPEALATSGRLAQELDGAQVVLAEGPTLTAHDARAPVVSTQLGHDPRWPRLAARTAGDGVGVVAVPMELAGERLGVLTVYAPVVDGPLVEAAELVAATVPGLLRELQLNHELDRLAEDMRRALESRATIEQAKGIIMAHQGVGPEEAFQHLLALSSARNVKVRVLAAQIVAARPQR